MQLNTSPTSIAIENQFLGYTAVYSEHKITHAIAVARKNFYNRTRRKLLFGKITAETSLNIKMLSNGKKKYFTESR